MKKIYLLSLLMAASIGLFAQGGTWVSQATGFSDLSSGVRHVSVVDTNTVWICSYDGSGGAANRQDYSRTTDGGATWAAGLIPGAAATLDWSMIYGLDANTAWAMLYNTAAAGGGLWKTSDGGSTWSQQGVGSIFAGSLSFPNVVHFWDANNGMVMGDPTPATWFEIHTTNDGGATWTRVPSANIPAPLSGEYGIVGHYSVIGDTMWFDTNKGRVYRSIDRGLNWTVSSTGITVPANGAIDICFTSASNGLARLYNATTGGNSMRITTDGGTTWTAATPTGNFFGSDVKNVPGSARMVSTGAATGFVGSSYSDDGGLNWTTIEATAQRTALGIADADHMWAGGFTTSSTSDGIYKYQIIPTVTCTTAGVSAGTSVIASAVQLCGGDTAEFTASGVFAPTVGAYAGVSWVITSADISGSSSPLTEPSLVASYTFNFPAPATSLRQFVNNGTLINGTNVPYGTYYWTPVVFGNAIAATNPPTFLGDLQLDPSCTLTGTSVAVAVLDPADPQCSGTGLNEVNASLPIRTRIVAEQLELRFETNTGGVAMLDVYDLSGRLVLTRNAATASGENTIFLDASAFSAGTYVVKVALNGFAGQAKVVKM
jgi:hypothetical protein